MRTWITVLSLAAVVACGSDPVGPVVETVGDTTFMRLPYGTSATAGDLSVAFDAVVEDSRCPLGVVCIQTGTAVVELSLADPSSSDVVTLGLGAEIDFGGHRIGLRDLTPYPVYGKPHAEGDYVAHLAIYETP